MFDDEEKLEQASEFIAGMFDEKMAAIQESAYRQILAAMEKKNIPVPFDFVLTASSTYLLYGYLGDGDMIGKTVKFNGKTIYDIYGKEHACFAFVGTVCGDYHGRVVINEPYQDVYLGWIDKNLVEIVHVHDAEYNEKYIN